MTGLALKDCHCQLRPAGRGDEHVEATGRLTYLDEGGAEERGHERRDHAVVQARACGLPNSRAASIAPSKMSAASSSRPSMTRATPSDWVSWGKSWPCPVARPTSRPRAACAAASW